MKKDDNGKNAVPIFAAQKRVVPGAATGSYRHFWTCFYPLRQDSVFVVAGS
jgi:hypothetical protein